MKHKLKHAYSLSAREWVLLAEAWLTISWIDFVISLLPYHWWKSWLFNQYEAETHQAANLEHLVWSVNAAADHHLRKPTCLRRSLTLKQMLQRRKIPAKLRIGINKDGADLKAHAWIEYTGIVLNDSPDIATSYSQFPVFEEKLLRRL